MLKKIITTIFSLILILSLTACQMDTQNIIWGIEEEKITYEYDNTIYLATEKIRDLNPLISKDEGVYFISKLVFDSLFRLDEQLVPQPQLAKSYSYNENGTELTIQIRNDVLFHDGTQLTGEDVKFTIEAIKSLAKTGETLYSSHVASIKSVAVSKDNPYEITIKYSSIYDTGYENLIFPILPAHMFSSSSTLKKESKDYKMTGTGPYKLDEYFELTSLILVPNESYFSNKATNTLKFQIIPNISYATSMADSGDITLFFDDAVNKDSILSKYDLEVSTFLSNKPEVIGFNCTKDLFSKSAIRQAVAYAINAPEILEKAYYKNGVIADSILYPDYYGVSNKGDVYAYDTEKAVKILKKENCTDTDNDGLINYKEGENISLDLIVLDSDSARMKAATMISDYLKSIGITVNIIPCTETEYNERLYIKNYDLFLGGFAIDERYDIRSLVCTGYGNVAGFSNTEIDKLLSEIVCGNKQYNKSELISKLKEELIKELPYYTLLYKAQACYRSEYFDGLAAPMFNDIYRGCKNWQCKYPENFIQN